MAKNNTHFLSTQISWVHKLDNNQQIKVVASYMISSSSFGLHTTLCEMEMFYLTAVFYDDENNASGMINVLIPTCWRNVDEMNMTFIDWMSAKLFQL